MINLCVRWIKVQSHTTHRFQPHAPGFLLFLGFNSLQCLQFSYWESVSFLISQTFGMLRPGHLSAITSQHCNSRVV